MKKRDIIVAAVVLTAALLFWLAGQLTKREPEVLRITVAGEVYGTYSLKENQKISIQDTNVCQIQDGYVTMTEADCPDQICVQTARISEDGGSIVCLPNKIVLEIVGEEKDEPELDSISS